MPMMAVHPHVCGERVLNGGNVYRGDGSSPRVWGTGTASSYFSRSNRFIPTCVGNGHMVRQAGQHITVHPHVCGERVANVIGVLLMRGSSPRVWGTGLARSAKGTRRWFIPTCVGNGARQRDQAALISVHPHVCGERCRGTGSHLI